MTLRGNDRLRLPLLTAAQVRAAVPCDCGAAKGHQCIRWTRGAPTFTPANHRSRVAAARLLLTPPTPQEYHAAGART